MNRYKIREHAFKLLFLTEFYTEADREDQLELYFDREEMQEADKTSKDAILGKYYGVIDNREQIDTQINKVARGWHTDRMGRVDLSILRLAAYEMHYDDSVPFGVAINEAVELGKKYGQDESAAFVNGVLAKLV